MDSEIRSLQSPNKLCDYYHKAYFKLGIAKNQAAFIALLIGNFDTDRASLFCLPLQRIHKIFSTSVHFFINYS